MSQQSKPPASTSGALRELYSREVRHAAAIAEPVFQANLWTWASDEREHVPSYRELCETINDLVERCKGDGCTHSSGRFTVSRCGTEGLEILLEIGEVWSTIAECWTPEPDPLAELKGQIFRATGIDYDDFTEKWWVPAEPGPIECDSLEDALRAFARLTDLSKEVPNV